MAKKYDYDLVVVGAGSAGLVAATYACRLGARVALVEKARVGGDCTWTGCVPSKALIHVARVAHAARTAFSYGIGAEEPNLDTNMDKVRDYISRAISDVYAQETPELLKAEGIEVVTGPGHFTGPHVLQAGDRKLSARAFILCTGAHPTMPKATGLDSVPYVTYEQLFSNNRLPDHLIVVGGGPVGLEMAQAYGRLGSHVTLIATQLLPREEPEIGPLLATIFSAGGLDWVCGRASAFRKRGDSVVATVGEREISGNMLLVAAGRSPTVDGMDLEKAGVVYSAKGIRTNKHLQTSAAHIYAAGDCTGGPQFTHYAGWQGFQAVRNALLPGSSQGKSEVVPSVTYTDPEIARVGCTEAEARRKYHNSIVVTTRSMATVDRAITENSRDGFIKAIYKKDGTLLGATVVAPRAGEVITEFVLALTKGMKIGDLAGPIHPYPTYSTPVQQMASDVAFSSFLCSMPGKVIRRLSGLPMSGSYTSSAE